MAVTQLLNIAIGRNGFGNSMEGGLGVWLACVRILGSGKYMYEVQVQMNARVHACGLCVRVCACALEQCCLFYMCLRLLLALLHESFF